MAGRFLFRKLSSSRMSRSATGLLGPHAPPASAAALTTVERRSWAARYFNTLPCTRAASETGSRAAFVNSVGVRRPFSSTNDTITRTAQWHAILAANKAEVADWFAKKKATSTNHTITRTAEWHAKLAANKAEVTDWFAKKKAEDDAFIRFVAIFVGAWCLIFWGCFSMLGSGSSSHSDTSCSQGKSDSHRQCNQESKISKCQSGC